MVVGVVDVYSYDRWNRNAWRSLLVLHVITTCEDRSDWVDVARVVLGFYTGPSCIRLTDCRFEDGQWLGQTLFLLPSSG